MRNIWCGYGVAGHFAVPAIAILGVSPLWSIPAAPGLLLYETVTVYLVLASWRTRTHLS